MFTGLFKKTVPEKTGESLWSQCYDKLLEIRKASGSTEIDLEEVAQLVIMVARQELCGDFSMEIQEVISDAVNGFTDAIPF
jgi:hypothetical protein